MMVVKPRYELKNTRLRAGLTEAELAEKIGSDAETVRRWEAGIQTPYAHFVKKLCDFFNVDHPKELNLDAQFGAPTQSREEFAEMLRRKALEYIGAATIVTGIDPVVVLRAIVDDPNEFLFACRAVLDDCWDRHNQNRNTLVDNTIKTIMPGLRELATEKSPYQHEAASLTIEAKILQLEIAAHKEDYQRRVSLGSDAVLIGETSGDKNLHTIAVGWHSNTYLNYNQPETAIDILNKALPHINNVSPLNQAAIYMELFRACVLDKKDTDENTKKARDYVELAHMAMPEDPESDPLYQCIRVGQSELDKYEGKMYLVLAKHFPANKEYGQKAFDTLVKSTTKEAMDTGHRCDALIHQAEAARCVNNMTYYFDCLEEGSRIALYRGYQDLSTKIIFALQKTPRKWRNEQQYKDLCKILTPNIVIARR